jgi:hypothetical protein
VTDSCHRTPKIETKEATAGLQVRYHVNNMEEVNVILSVVAVKRHSPD